MQLVVKGKNLDLAAPVQTYVQKKLSKLNRYLDSIAEVQVEVSLEKTRSAQDRFVVQVTMRANGAVLRGEERGADIRTAVDAVFDVLHRKLVRYKEKLYGRRKGGGPRAAISEGLPAPTEVEGRQIVRVKRVSLKPMPAAEAAEQMELLGHDFFVFLDAEGDAISILYRRRDGHYGLIVPEVG